MPSQSWQVSWTVSWKRSLGRSGITRLCLCARSVTCPFSRLSSRSRSNNSSKRFAADAKSTAIFFDVHFKVSEFGGLACVSEIMQQGELDHWPLPLCLAGKLPPSAKMGAVVQNLEDGAVNVVKITHFRDQVTVTHVSKLCTVHRKRFCSRFPSRRD